jgi:DNA-binding protein HU-beta
MSNHVESLTWLTDLHLEFCSHRTRDRFYHSINQAPGEIVIITGDLSAGPHRLAQYTELAEQIRKPVYFVLGNHDRYGTTFANAEAVVERVTTLFSHMVRLDGSQVTPRPTKEPLEVFLGTLSALAYKEIKKNGEFVLPGFGKLVKQKRKARTGFNPKTQQKIKIPAKTVVKFRVAKAAKDAVLGVKK